MATLNGGVVGVGGRRIESLSLVEMVIGPIFFEIVIGVINRENNLPSFHFLDNFLSGTVDSF